MTLKQQIVAHLFKQGDWVKKYKLFEQIWYHDNQHKKYMPNSVDRELRRAEEESQIAQRGDPDSVSIEYKHIPEHMRSRYIPYWKRLDKTVLFKP